MITFVLISLALVAQVAGAVDVQPRLLDVATGERLLVIAPHPDDETLGVAGLIQRVLARSGTVRVVLVTAGDGYVEAVVHETGLPLPRPAQYISYGERRLAESRAALRVLGGDRVRLTLLGFPDGGLGRLLQAHWLRSHPERSRTTGAADPPYSEALEPDVAYDGSDLERELVNVFREARPTILALPDPLDKHPDHLAAGLFALLAVDHWAGDGAKQRGTMPQLLAYLVHWPAWPPGWDAPPPGDSREAMLTLPAKLPRRRLDQTALLLTDDEMAGKRAALAKYRSQQEEMPSFLTAFIRRSEPFSVLTANDVKYVGHEIERQVVSAGSTVGTQLRHKRK